MNKSRNFLVWALIGASLLILSSCQADQSNTGGEKEQSSTTSSSLLGDTSSAQTGTSFFLNTINFIFLGFLAYYFIVLKPKVQEEDNQKKFLEGLNKNAEVITSGGILGKVVQKKADVVTVEIAPKINIRVLAKEVRPFKAEDSAS